MTDTTYEGWKNYETAAIKLYMDNDFDEYTYWRVRVLDADVNDLAGELKDYFEERLPTLDSPFSDLLTAAMSEVDWFEIAEDLLTTRDEGE